MNRPLTLMNDPRTEKALNVGRALARRIFETRGNHTEVHVSEAELAAMLALAAERALRDAA